MSAAAGIVLDDLFRGLVFFGTGGGGRAAAGIALLRAHFGPDYQPRFTDPASLPRDAFACATIVLGGRDPEEDVSAEERHALGVPAADLAMGERFARAVTALERATGRTITALAVVELGSLAMAATLVAADLLGKAVLDADGTGRSIPELGLSKLDLVGLAPAPLALVDRFGGETVLLSSPSAAMADRLGRHVSRAVWGRGLACAGYLQPAASFGQGLVAGSVERAQTAGQLLGGAEPPKVRLAAVVAAFDAHLLFEGVAKQTHWRSQEPYRFRELDYFIEGTGRDEGRQCSIWVKNEHHLVMRDGVLVASSPDPIAVLDASTLEPLTTLGDVTPGRAVSIVAVPSLDPIWRTPVGRNLLGPRRFGFDFDPVLIGGDRNTA
ncbi:DUF917 domain-containing protein [Lichenifustis flavocetrariae]|uniref:DUF917 domain-containing protein n=1 Tax=Lichenifustis flavocetrariae TaxID=2949735 RepID=A0AA41Z2J9_9HYPH|nr:DUF917 domain-containing protein [Lichenifustis flavocetrariae]MCW6511816.1 DUF917 domain-containing protein [Lichenifustis flavocetrariae]